MRNKQFLCWALAAVATLFLAAGLYAASTVPDVIPMENPAYEHTKGIVQFSHAKHAGEYGAGCGDCHHDADGKPLTDLKEGDEVQGCIECHKKPGEVPTDIKKKWREEKLSRKEKKSKELEYHAEALHENCKGCHRDYNKKNKTKDAPTACTGCHPKTE
jgi:hypothetical protein